MSIQGSYVSSTATGARSKEHWSRGTERTPRDERASLEFLPAWATQELLALRGAVQQEREARRQAETRWLALAGDLRSIHQRTLSLAAQLDQAYLETISGFARAVGARDHGTGCHVERVRDLSVTIAERLGISGNERRQLEFGALLHDIGKIGVPDTILSKEGPLSMEEWEIMRMHPAIGRQMLEGIVFLDSALDAVITHHERLDGSGYPHRLRGDSIPLVGRIVAVADAYDAMTSDRPYRRGLPAELAQAEIARQRGIQFCPRVVDAFLAYPRPAIGQAA